MVGRPVERGLIAATFPTGLQHDGVVVYVGECHCRGCGEAALGLRIGRATAELQHLRWRKLDRKWFCSTCAETYAAARA